MDTLQEVFIVNVMKSEKREIQRGWNMTRGKLEEVDVS